MGVCALPIRMFVGAQYCPLGPDHKMKGVSVHLLRVYDDFIVQVGRMYSNTVDSV